MVPKDFKKFSKSSGVSRIELNGVDNMERGPLVGVGSKAVILCGQGRTVEQSGGKEKSAQDA